MTFTHNGKVSPNSFRFWYLVAPPDLVDKAHAALRAWFEAEGTKYTLIYHVREGRENERDKSDGLRTLWHENGQKIEEGKCSDGRKDGPWTIWYKNGQKKSEGVLKDGKIDGLRMLWYENGQKRLEGIYKAGKLNGQMTQWNENGQKNNKPITTSPVSPVTPDNIRLTLSACPDNVQAIYRILLQGWKAAGGTVQCAKPGRICLNPLPE
ncbi:MAG TPA: hypothetical protein VKF42_03885 [Chitinivibrionales bacterium]|nr:hypothetical protein [Chitinivibrionales bacterium]